MTTTNLSCFDYINYTPNDDGRRFTHPIITHSWYYNMLQWAWHGREGGRERGVSLTFIWSFSHAPPPPQVEVMGRVFPKVRMFIGHTLEGYLAQIKTTTFNTLIKLYK